MHSGVPPGRKPALCRYYLNNGTCFYGDDCQFLHQGLNMQRSTGNNNPNMKPGQVEANNGDQFFTATFNGIPEFVPYAQRKGARPDKLSGNAQPFIPSPASSQPMNQNQMAGNFSAMNIDPRGKSLKPGAVEFVPKGSPQLAHSASSPTFASYGGMSYEGDMHPASGPAHSKTPTSDMSHNGAEATEDNSISQDAIEAAQAAMMGEDVGGTTYFFSQVDEAISNQGRPVFPNFNQYAGVLPHVAHMKIKPNMPSFFLSDEMKIEILNKQLVTLADIEESADIPSEVDTYHRLFPLEMSPNNPMQKSSTFGFPTTTYKATNTKDGLVYCLRRIHGFRLSSTKCMSLIDMWKKIQHSNIVSLREVFTTKEFGDNSMVFVYDYHPRSETLMAKHFSNPPQGTMSNGYSNPYNLDGQARPYSAGKGTPRQHAGLLPESLIWTHVIQLSSALRTIHAQNLACRVMDPTKIILTDKSRLRLNCIGIFDVLSFDANQQNPLSVMPLYQQEDLISLGKVVLALACNSVIGIQRDHVQTSLELVARNYSADLKNLILYLLTNSNRMRSVNDIMPMIGARFYTQLDSAQLRNDVLDNELAKEVENSRLFRVVCKLGIINERQELNLDPSWSDTGDRYVLKLFRDYLFHQVDESGAAWIDVAHIVQCLNKLEAGIPEKICLSSRDQQSVVIASYEELKRSFESAFSELLSSGNSSGAGANSVMM